MAEKTKNIKTVSISLSFCILLILPAIASYAQNEIPQEEQIRKLESDYKHDYKALKKSRKETEKKEKNIEAIEQAKFYYDIGKKMEDQGRLKESEVMYKKAHKVISDVSNKRYNLKTNGKLKSEAKIYKYRILKTLKKKNKELKKLEKEKTNCIVKLEKWVSLRERKQTSKEPKESIKIQDKINNCIAEAENFSAEGNYENSRKFYKKAFRLSKDLERKKLLLDNISASFDEEIENRATLINNVESLKRTGDNYYQYANYDNAYGQYIQAYNLMLAPEKQPKKVRMTMPALP